jgi:hypothetical protein
MSIKKWVGNGVIIIIKYKYLLILSWHYIILNVPVKLVESSYCILGTEYVQTWNGDVVGIQVLCSAPASNRALFQARPSSPASMYCI